MKIFAISIKLTLTLSEGTLYFISAVKRSYDLSLGAVGHSFHVVEVVRSIRGLGHGVSVNYKIVLSRRFSILESLIE